MEILWLTFQISHARRAWVPPLLKYEAMLSGDIIGDSGEIKGVALWMTGWPVFFKWKGSAPLSRK